MATCSIQWTDPLSKDTSEMRTFSDLTNIWTLPIGVGIRSSHDGHPHNIPSSEIRLSICVSSSHQSLPPAHKNVH
ncbi:hypothetical protein GBAR_LOCUS13701 [Geodia barretti]|uniref:Uncharacterized protein n=1 Tax=Geodia barretti TaxID=519541 RepID=A0AA35S765_GEOBA|nr:hypothetical protein GBAR_LOCUS13701 [Geodia barretti]